MSGFPSDIDIISGQLDRITELLDRLARAFEDAPTRIEAIDIGPNDQLYLMYDHALSMEQSAKLRETFERVTGLNNRVVILDEGGKMAAVRQP